MYRKRQEERETELKQLITFLENMILHRGQISEAIELLEERVQKNYELAQEEEKMNLEWIERSDQQYALDTLGVN
jgi:hypothetical protein